jgi:hypothetical protein
MFGYSLSADAVRTQGFDFRAFGFGALLVIFGINPIAWNPGIVFARERHLRRHFGFPFPLFVKTI